ncbi:uncharacterized protein METZ01_LOCUS271521, partial [marine metagenome]
WFDRVAVDLHDNHATGRPQALIRSKLVEAAPNPIEVIVDDFVIDRCLFAHLGNDMGSDRRFGIVARCRLDLLDDLVKPEHVTTMSAA